MKDVKNESQVQMKDVKSKNKSIIVQYSQLSTNPILFGKLIN